MEKKMNAEQNWLDRAKSLQLHGLISHWDELDNKKWAQKIIQWEEAERTQRSLTRRLSDAHLGSFKDMVDFDWDWPKKCDQSLVEELMGLDFIKEKANVILCGPNGAGKTMIVKNIAYQAIMNGRSALFTSAGSMLNNLASQDGDYALRRRLRNYSKPDLLVVDEVGYLSYSTRHADLLFEIVNRRYDEKSIIVTINKPFGEWNEIFPSASCVVSLIDRLVHNSEILNIEADSYRLKESQEKSKKRQAQRKKRAKKSK
jgi:DNA replication protein DnaC